ncbi:MAG: hypothetical protein LBN29_01705 [Mediterranea sp.]|jgi:hypothetical protein|nr:hypothetical protein [Mediterranea sp.]
MERTLRSAEALERAVLKLGFLPFFRSPIPGFSVEEMTPEEYWFEAGVEGPWEWKGPVIREWNCTYGKFFRGKAGYISLEWLPDWVNYRRAGYRFDAASPGGEGHEGRERQIYEAIVKHESLLIREIRSICEPGKPAHAIIGRGRRESLEAALGRLQMGTLVVIADFEYALDKRDRPYGWGLARYTTPEALFGEEAILSARVRRTPEESKRRLVDHLHQITPWASEAQILKIIG